MKYVSKANIITNSIALLDNERFFYFPNGVSTETSLLQPTDIDGLSLWLDADDSSTLTVDGSNNVSQWDDKSGNGYNYSQSTLTRQPKYNSSIGAVYNDFPNSNGNSNGHRLVNSDGVTKEFTEGTIFTVAKELANLSSRNGAPYRFHGVDKNRLTWSNSAMYSGILRNNRVNFVPSTDTTQKHLFSVESDFATEYNIRFNGETTPDYTDGVTGYSKPTTDTFVLSGSRESENGGQAFEGEVYEILVYGSFLNKDQRQKVEGYLAHKWGLTANLPSNHPYKSEAPTQ